MAGLRGLESHQEQNYSQIIRDTRTLGQRIGDFLKNPRGVAGLLFCWAVSAFLLPWLSDVLLISGIFFFLYCYFRKAKLPFRLPMRSHLKDPNDLIPGSKKPRMARGIYFFGNEIKTEEELWFSNEDMRTHVLIFGSTGSGKTEMLVSLAYNALLQSSGFIYVDGKGDNSLFSKVFSMVRTMGRDDDLLLINFMTGGKDIIGPQEKRLSNTINPFGRGSSSMLSQLIVSMMDSSSATPDGDMWKGRAIAFVEALMKVLVAMRDAGHILLDANTIRNYFHLNRLETMVMDNAFIRDGADTISLEGLPETVMEPIRNYVYNLPGYNQEKKGQQVSQVLEQHGFITMQLTRVFTSLADTYGHIMRTKLAEVDLKDVVLNRRILVVLLPALEKSPDELSNLGKVIIATLRVMMASGLGEHVEGEYADLVQSKPTNSRTPYLCILDEYGYYAVKGFAVVPAQARSLGFSVVFAGQDLPAFQRASKEEAMSIGANTNIKICMKLEDPLETWDFFMKSAGESYVTHVDSFSVDQGSVLGTYQDAKGAKLEKRSRIDLLDLKEQAEGEMHILFKSKIVRARTFYADPKHAKTLRLNHFLKVDLPNDPEIIRTVNLFKNFEELVNGGRDFLSVNTMGDEVSQIIDRFHQQPYDMPLERAAALLGEIQVSSPHLATAEAETVSNFEGGYLDIFLPMTHSEHVQQYMITPDAQTFGQPLLNRTEVRDQLEYIERLCGANPQKSMDQALDLVREMQKGTKYPPPVLPTTPPDELALIATQVTEAIALKKEEAQKKEDKSK